MKYTQNYNLRKPEDTDPADIQDLNYNADAIDGKLKEIEDWEAAHLQASNPHSITPALISAETPTGAQQKANQAETNAKSYADIVTNSTLNSAKDYADDVLESANSHTDQVASDLSQKVDEIKIKVLDVEQDVSNITKALTNLNPNQEPKQKVNGYGIIPLPKNAANGQVSVSVKGLTATNLVKNGNFENGLIGWEKSTGSGSNLSIENNMLKIITAEIAGAFSSAISCSTTDYLFVSFDYKSEDNNSIRIIPETSTTNLGTFSVESSSAIYRKGIKVTDINSTDGAIRLYLRNLGDSTSYWDNVQVVKISQDEYNNLSEQDLMKKYPYINGDDTKSTISAGRITAKNEGETEQSQLYYIAKDKTTGEILQARSLPNGTKDEVRVSKGKLIKRVSDEVNTWNLTWSRVEGADTNDYYGIRTYDLNSLPTYVRHSVYMSKGEYTSNYTSGYLTNNDLVYYDSGHGMDFRFKVPKSVFTNNWSLAETKAWLEQNQVTLTYQLAEPIITPIETSGTLMSYPSGTIYVENAVADAGIYTDKMSVLHQDLPIKALEKISKVDFDTGLETELDITAAVIAEDKLSFTHPDLTSGDIVFFVYEHGAEGTIPETEISYYDSRYVIKGEDDKFYQWEIEAKLVEGVITPSIKLVEV